MSAMSMQSSLCHKTQAFTLSLLVCLGWPLQALADVSSADALLRAGQRLRADGKQSEACEKFAASQREEPSASALLNLARCHAEGGMSATAHSEYLAAARLARTQGKTKQAEEAELSATELTPRLTYLLIRVPAQRATEVVVSRDGEELPPNLDEPLPVDPGSHVLNAKATGYADWSTTVVLSQPGQVLTVTIPELTPLQRPRVPQRVRALSAAPERRASPTRAWVAAGVGAGTLLSAAVLGWIAKSDWDDVNTRGLCQAGRCSHEGLAERQQAQNLADLATTGVVISVAAFASAVLLYNERPKRKASVSVGMGFGRTTSSLILRGEF